MNDTIGINIQLWLAAYALRPVAHERIEYLNALDFMNLQYKLKSLNHRLDKHDWLLVIGHKCQTSIRLHRGRI